MDTVAVLRASCPSICCEDRKQRWSTELDSHLAQKKCQSEKYLGAIDSTRVVSRRSGGRLAVQSKQGAPEGPEKQRYAYERADHARS